MVYQCKFCHKTFSVKEMEGKVWTCGANFSDIFDCGPKFEVIDITKQIKKSLRRVNYV